MDKTKTDDVSEKKVEEIVTDEPTDTDMNENENEKFEKRIIELEDQLKRAVADYKNLERRSFEEKIEAVKFANKQLIESLMPAFDTMFLAAKYTSDESVKLTVTRVLEVLKENGIEKVGTDNAKYNAELMEAIEVVDGEEGAVVEEVRPGFTIHGKLIRPAQVKVGKGK